MLELGTGLLLSLPNGLAKAGELVGALELSFSAVGSSEVAIPACDVFGDELDGLVEIATDSPGGCGDILDPGGDVVLEIDTN